MSEEHPTPEQAPVPEAALTREDAPAPAATRWRDTLWTFRSVIAVALASLLVGGAGGALIVAATNGDDGPDHGRMMIFEGPGRGHGPKFRNGPFKNHGNGPRWQGDDGAQPPAPGTRPTPPSSPTTPTPSQ